MQVRDVTMFWRELMVATQVRRFCRLQAALFASTVVAMLVPFAQPAMAACTSSSSGSFGTVFVTCSGTIVSSGISAVDYQPAFNGLNITSTATIRTTGDDGNGILGASGSGNVSITSSGAISTTGALAYGIAGVSSFGSLAMRSSGAISTAGPNAVGIFGYSIWGNSSIASSSAITTNGANSHGIFGVSGAADLSIASSGAISTRGIDAFGIIAISSGGSATVYITGGTVIGGSGFGGGVGIDAVASSARLTNSGTIGALSGRAIEAYGTGVSVDNSGVISGNVGLFGYANSTTAFNNLNGGVFNSGAWTDVFRGTLTNAGTVSPGGSGVIQTTTLTGNYLQTSTGVLKIDADWTGNASAGAADKLAISGTAVLAGTVIVNPLNFPTTGGLTKQFTILTAAGGIMDNGIAAQNSATVTYALLKPDANTLNLKASINFAGVGTTGLGTNQTSVGSNLNTILGGGTTLGFMPALMTLPTGSALGQALNQLAPVGDGGSNSSTMSTGATFAGQMLSCRVAGEGDAHAVIREGQCVWARGNARRLDRDASNDNVGLRETATFFSAGAQLKLHGDWRIGGGIGYETTDLNTATNASSKGERLHLGGIIKYNPGPWLLAAGVTGGHGWHDNIRRVAFDGFNAAATSHSDTSFIASRLTAAYLLQMGALYLKPQVEVAATRLNRDGYSESSNGGIALIVRENHATVWSASPSLELGTEHRAANGGVVRFFVKGGATWLDTDKFTTTASFAGAPAGTTPFAVTSKVDKVVADVGAGIDLITKGDTALRLQYDGQFGDTTTQHGGSAKLGVRF